MELSKSVAILKDFTKDEIIAWVQSRCFFHAPKRSDLLLIRWERQSEKLLKERDALSGELKAIDLKKRDEYAKQFNATKDIQEKALLIKKMAPYYKKLKAWFKKSDAIDKRDRACDELYDSIDKARKNET